MPAFSLSRFVFVLLKQFFDNLSLYHVHSYSLILSWLSHVILCIYLSRLYFINLSHEEGRVCRGIQEYATHWMWKFNTVENIGLPMSYEDGGINSTTTIIDKVLLCEKFSWEKYWFWEGIHGIVVSNHSFCTAKNSHSKMLSRSHVLYLLNSYYAIQCKLVHCSLITMINKQIPCILAGWRCSLWLCDSVTLCYCWICLQIVSSCVIFRCEQIHWFPAWHGSFAPVCLADTWLIVTTHVPYYPYMIEETGTAKETMFVFTRPIVSYVESWCTG